jgi:hypothetical protein
MRIIHFNRRKFVVGFVALIGFYSIIFGPGSNNGWSAPSISGVEGSISDQGSITIAGSGFGNTGPTVILFDDFESGTNGGVLGNRVVSAPVGTWRDTSYACDPYYATYSNTAAHSGSQALRQNWGSGSGTQEGARWNAPTMGGPHTQIYFSFWMYLPSGQNVPGGCTGTGCGYGANWKTWWLSSNDYHADDFANEIVTNSLPGQMSFGWVDGSQNRAQAGYVNSHFTKGRWERFEVYMVGSTSAGSITEWYTNSATARSQFATASGRTLDNGSPGWNYLHFPGFGRYDSNSNTYYDDIYVAAGTGARARVEIGNQSTYNSCTNLAVFTPTSWSDTQIVTTVRKGSFAQGQTAYLFVIDASGAANATGFPVVIGGESAAPAAPKGLKIP